MLASASVPAESVPVHPQWAFVAIPIGPVPVSVGSQYAIALSSSDDWGASYEFSDVYAGGQLYVSTNRETTYSLWPGDLTFRTYVAPSSPPAPLCDAVRALATGVEAADLDAGTATSLLAKLRAAERTVCDGDPANASKAVGPLRAFAHEVRAQNDKAVPMAVAAQLGADAEEIVKSLGG